MVDRQELKNIKPEQTHRVQMHGLECVYERNTGRLHVCKRFNQPDG